MQFPNVKIVLTEKVNNMFKNWDNLSCIILLRGKLFNLIIAGGLFLKYGGLVLLRKAIDLKHQAAF